MKEKQIPWSLNSLAAFAGLLLFQVFETCIKKNLMIRDCTSFQCLEGEFIRFCIMNPQNNQMLLNVLKGL